MTFVSAQDRRPRSPVSLPGALREDPHAGLHFKDSRRRRLREQLRTSAHQRGYDRLSVRASESRVRDEGAPRESVNDLVF